MDLGEISCTISADLSLWVAFWLTQQRLISSINNNKVKWQRHWHQMASRQKSGRITSVKSSESSNEAFILGNIWSSYWYFFSITSCLLNLCKAMHQVKKWKLLSGVLKQLNRSINHERMQPFSLWPIIQGQGTFSFLRKKKKTQNVFPPYYPKPKTVFLCLGRLMARTQIDALDFHQTPSIAALEGTLEVKTCFQTNTGGQ